MVDRSSTPPVPHDVVVVGASMGGVDALSRLLAGLPGDWPGIVLIVLHISRDHPSLLPGILSKAGGLPVIEPDGSTSLEWGRVYVAPPDRHLLLQRDCVQAVRGPLQNRHRPAIDPLFRSAAAAYGSRLAGVILTGTQDDGAAGLWTVKSAGGITIVQDPSEARYPEMPSQAMLHVDVDYCLPIRQIAELLVALAPRPPVSPHPPFVARGCGDSEAAMFDQGGRELKAPGTVSAFTCPACGGALFELREDQLLEYRCHTGHAFTLDSLVAEQTEHTERALYTAMRSLKEQAVAAQSLAEGYGTRFPQLAERQRDRVAELESAAAVLRHLLMGMKSD